MRNARRFAYIPMYLCLALLLVAGGFTVAPDIDFSDSSPRHRTAIYVFLGTAGLATLSILISVCSTVSVLQGQVSIDQQRERTVYIIALPSFYCLMCFLSAQQLLMYILGTLDDHWAWEVQFQSDEERVDFTMSMSLFYFSAADVFEAFAFTFFGMLTMESLHRATVTSKRASTRSFGTGAREMRLQNCVKNWTMSPIYMFCTVLWVEAVYNLVGVFSKYFNLRNILPPALVSLFNGVHLDSDVVEITFFTLTSIFSSLAIMALFSIEHVFHDDLASVDFVLEISERCRNLKFLSNLKFWGVKIFVTAEFSLQCCMLFLRMDKIEKQLIFTVCMSALCFMVALLHIWAYAPRGMWIANKEALEDEGEEADGLADLPARPESLMRSGSEDDASDTGVSLPSLRIQESQDLASQLLTESILEAQRTDQNKAAKKGRANSVTIEN